MTIEPIDFIQNIEIKQCELSFATKLELEEIINKSTRLRMVVAFWTIDPDVISKNLSKLLAKSGSFACVDFHYPTNTDRICDLAEYGSSMFFHGKRIIEKNRPDGKTPKLATNLLHSKVLLFDISENKAELWVGSHNWTEYALGGFNIETSLRIELSRNNKLYFDAENLLDTIHNQCHPVDPNLRKIYKAIQEPEATVSAITLRLEEDLDVIEKSFINMFGSNLDDFKSPFSTIGKKIYITIRNSITNNESIFESTVTDAGYLPKAKPEKEWVNLQEGFWAIHHRNYLKSVPVIHRRTVPEESILSSQAMFYATLQLDKDVSEHVRLDPPLDISPYVSAETQVSSTKMGDGWRETHGWVHPDRNSPPQIKEIQFKDLEKYQYSEERRVELLYGTIHENQSDHLSPISQQPESDGTVPILLGYERPTPLLRKLVLRSDHGD